jgi:uncharacterized protein (DUF362 family)
MSCMAKGVAIKFKSYDDTISKLLNLIKFNIEIKKHKKIVLKPHLDVVESKSTPWQFIEQILDYCMKNKNEDSEIYIAEGADFADTMDLFDQLGYRKLAEQYSVGLVDLNNAEVDEIFDGEFLKFPNIKYPKILLDSFIISLPKLSDDEEFEMNGSLSIMRGAYPGKFYTGFFSSKKNKIRKWPNKYAIHDIIVCKMPEFSVIDASEKGYILAGLPLEMDKQAAKLLGRDWKTISHIRLVDESLSSKMNKENNKDDVKETPAEEN